MSDDLVKSHPKRLQFLDGLRGLAILLVIGFHAFVRYPGLMPYGDRYTQVAPLRYGWVGVELFFLISGFVIFLTLEKSRSFPDFITRRWLRLFPAMLICSAVIYVAFSFILDNSFKSVSLRALLPGLTFIEPHTWSVVLRSPQTALEGSFWSLFVEVRFYAVSGILFFWIGEKNTIRAIIAMFLISASIPPLAYLFPSANLHLLEIFRGWTSSEHFGWFAAGALYFRYFQKRLPSLFYKATGMAMLAALATGSGNAGPTIAALVVVALFAFAVAHEWLHRFLRTRVLLFLGFVSYPLYLVHESIMVTLIIKLGKLAPWLPDAAFAIPPIGVVLLIGFVIAKYIEPWLTGIIRPRYLQVRHILGIDSLRLPADLRKPTA